jgi:hypothetical protein
MTIYLYLKTHNKTGLKYLGKTKQNPLKYRGSGKYWVNHLKKHGNDVTTEILFKSCFPEEIKQKGLYYSNLWNIVESNTFANIKNETGDGGAYYWDGMIEHLKSISKKGAAAAAAKVKGTDPWNKGKTGIYSEEAKIAIGKGGETRCGVKRGKYKNYNHDICSRSITIYGVTYCSIAEARKATGHSYYTLIKRNES